jgi:hypothetical protein
MTAFGVERGVQDPKKTIEKIGRQRQQLNRAVVATVSSTRKVLTGQPQWH